MAVAESLLARPLCVDLDASVVRTDLLLEGLLRLVKRNPAHLLFAAIWLLRGTAALKAEVARRVRIDPATLPYNVEVLNWLKEERAHGRQLWLCSASNEELARTVAAHLGLFEGVIASDAAGVAGGEAVPHRRGTAATNSWRLMIRALRVHQWAKNALLFVPLLAAHRAGDLAAIGRASLAFVAFCLCASSVYILNDMLDLEADRAHARKCRRPFASGDLSLAAGFWLVPILLTSAAAVAVSLPWEFQLALAAYYVLTTAYSLALKGMMLIDAIALAGLYTLRVIAGAAAVEIPLSFWLLLFSVFLFLSLALVKRYAELDALRRGRQLKAAGRGYHVEDLPMLEAMGISAGYLSVLVLALYINSPATVPLYRHPVAIWPLCVLLLYWVTRIWMKTHRGKMHDDPVVFALRDRISIATGVLAAVTIGLAI